NSKKRNTWRSAADLSKPYLDKNDLKNNSATRGNEIPEWLAKLNKKDKKSRTNTERDQIKGIEYISFIINQHNSEIQDCYHDYLKISPSVRGRMVVRIIVNKKGQVDQVTIKESDIKEDDFKNRIIKIIKKWDNLGQGNPENKVYLQEYVFGE
ncbi:MAG: AgmX/PglI C-terminal domain-containing protein, partial [Calditrichaeota bacterium]|nr:AgmX/PglI C-terminal domain-containing protein [Calditrichota bacterium]